MKKKIPSREFKFFFGVKFLFLPSTERFFFLCVIFYIFTPHFCCVRFFFIRWRRDGNVQKNRRVELLGKLCAAVQYAELVFCLSQGFRERKRLWWKEGNEESVEFFLKKFFVEVLVENIKCDEIWILLERKYNGFLRFKWFTFVLGNVQKRRRQNFRFFDPLCQQASSGPNPSPLNWRRLIWTFPLEESQDFLLKLTNFDQFHWRIYSSLFLFFVGELSLFWMI